MYCSLCRRNIGHGVDASLGWIRADARHKNVRAILWGCLERNAVINAAAIFRNGSGNFVIASGFGGFSQLFNDEFVERFAIIVVVDAVNFIAEKVIAEIIGVFIDAGIVRFDIGDADFIGLLSVRFVVIHA